MHDHAAGALDLDVLVAVAAILAGLSYVAAVAIQRSRGNIWPRRRSVLWLLGIAGATGGFVGPVAELAHDDFVAHMAQHVVVAMVAPLLLVLGAPVNFVAHMAQHVVVAMVAPLLLVLGAPVTLALRTMHATPARRVARVLNSRLARVIVHPITAAALNVGGMWLLYLTPLYPAMVGSAWVHTIVMLHLVLAGYLYTASLIAVDPNPHRAGFGMRTVVLLLSLAAHAVLAKVLYAAPPPGVPIDEGQAGAMLMYYLGDGVEVVLMVILCAQWYRRVGRKRAGVTNSSRVRAVEARH